MNRFTPLLRSINERLELPQPAKSRILLEISTDFEDLYDYHLNQGLSEEEAEQKALEKMDLSDEALKELVLIHESAFRKLLDRLSHETQSQWEKGALIFFILILVGIASRVVLTADFYQHASLMLWPMTGVTLTAVVFGLQRFYALHIKKKQRIRNLRQRMPLIAFLGLINLILGMMGYLLEMFKAGNFNLILISKQLFMIDSRNVGPEGVMNVVDWMMTSSTLMITSLFYTIIIAIIWFALENRVIRIEINEANGLLYEDSTQNSRRMS